MREALAAAEQAEAEAAGPGYPKVDHYETWQFIRYSGRSVTTSDVDNGPNSSGLDAKLVGKPEAEAMANYVAYDKDTLAINSKLRNGAKLTMEEKRRNDELDRVAAKTVISKPTDIWRGAVVSDEEYAQLVPGAVISDKGYASFSPDRKVAEYYSHFRASREDSKGRQVLFRVSAKDGDHIIPVRNDEWTLPRATRLVVTGISENGDVVEAKYE